MPSPTRPRRIPHDRARELRRRQTEPEKKLWARLRDGRIYGVKFRRQFPIGEFIADFACPAARLLVELDGAQHVVEADKDQGLTRPLADHGYRVLRFWNEEVLTNIEGVVTRILQELRASGIISEDQAGRCGPSGRIKDALTRNRRLGAVCFDLSLVRSGRGIKTKL